MKTVLNALLAFSVIAGVATSAHATSSGKLNAKAFFQQLDKTAR